MGVLGMLCEFWKLRTDTAIVAPAGGELVWNDWISLPAFGPEE
jgi:hypothetical protein